MGQIFFVVLCCVPDAEAMSCSYADGLSPYDNKGKLGLAEIFDSEAEVERKVTLLAEWVRQSGHTVFYTGAGISTSAGIPDFRGPRGVWTLERKGERPDVNVDWNDATPTPSHMALKGLIDQGKAHFVISQNIDGLHMRSGLKRRHLAELHGNMFVDACPVCKKQFVRGDGPAPTVGQKSVGKTCPGAGSGKNGKRGRPCRGKLVDFVLDWEHELPDTDLSLSDSHSILSQLSIVIGSTLQIVPAGTMPTLTKKYHPNGQGKLVIINLQPTKHDKKADLIIRCYVDKVMQKLFHILGQDIPPYDPQTDPTRSPELVEWTQDARNAKVLETESRVVEDSFKAELKRKRAEKTQNGDTKIAKTESDVTKIVESGQNGQSNVDELKVDTPIKVETEVQPELKPEPKEESG